MPIRELERLKAVNRYLKLNVSREAELQEITEQAAIVCESPIAMITFMDRDVQHILFQTGIGTELSQVPVEDTFCQHTIVQHDILIVPDASIQDPFSGNPFVQGDPNIRFYAGMPLTTSDDYNIGTLCVYDVVPRALTELQRQLLEGMARQVVHLLEFEASLQLLKEQYISSRETANKLRSFVESSGSCHLLMDKEMKIMAFNRIIYDVTLNAQSMELKEGAHALDFVHQNFKLNFEKYFHRALDGTVSFKETYFEHPNGRIYWYTSFAPAFDKNGEVMGVSFNATDISDRVAQAKHNRTQNSSLNKIEEIRLTQLIGPAQEIVGQMEELMKDTGTENDELFELLQIAVAELKQTLF